MTRLRSISTAALALLAVTALLASCGSTNSAAVTVNGTEVDDSEFRDELELLAENPEFAQGMFGASPSGDSPNAVDFAFAAEVLKVRVLRIVADDEFESRGLTVTDEDLTALDEEIPDSIRSSLADLPDDYRNEFRQWNAQLMVLGDALGEQAAERPDDVTDDDVRAFYDDFEVVFAEVACARHILVDTEDEAEDVIAELDAGADFGELAVERSIDPSVQQNQGDYGCNAPGQFVPEFEEAVWEGPVGEVQDPVETQYGFHVILVDRRGAPEFEAVADQIRAFLESPASRDGDQLLNLLLQQLIADADVEVDSQYGEWVPDTQTITPPEGPTTTTTSPAELVE